MTLSPAPSKQLTDLAKPFARSVIKSNPQGEDYVAHPVVNQALLAKVGPFDFAVTEIVRGHVPPIIANPQAQSNRAKEGRPALEGAVVAVLCELSCIVDERRVTIIEVGDCGDPHNWKHDGQRLKDAASDGLKRCAMRLGLGLHLWAQEHYALYDILSKRDDGQQLFPTVENVPTGDRV